MLSSSTFVSTRNAEKMTHSSELDHVVCFRICLSHSKHTAYHRRYGFSALKIEYEVSSRTYMSLESLQRHLVFVKPISRKQSTRDETR